MVIIPESVGYEGADAEWRTDRTAGMGPIVWLMLGVPFVILACIGAGALFAWVAP